MNLYGDGLSFYALDEYLYFIWIHLKMQLREEQTRSHSITTFAATIQPRQSLIEVGKSFAKFLPYKVY